MSLEERIAENTLALRELTAALQAAGALKDAKQIGTAPGVAKVAAAQKEAEVKKSDPKKADAEKVADAAPASGEPSAPTGGSSSPAQNSVELQPWHEKTAAKFAELKDGEANLENVRKAVLAINSLIGRPQAEAVLGRFGAQAVTEKKEGDKIVKRGVDEKQYPEFFKFALRALAGEIDATLSVDATE
jgi:hypothetical protein